MKKVIAVVACMVLVFAAYLAFSTVDTKAPAAIAAKAKTYTGTVYVAGMGGHFAAADVTIDPNDAENPIKVNKLDRVEIGTKDSHKTHDPRIDVNDPNKMFWSTYQVDKAVGGVHVGVSDLKTGKVLMDKVVTLDPRATWTGAVYCASGQTKNSFIPLTMTDEAYIDVFNKSDLAMTKRVFLDYKPKETKFYHGTNSPDMSKFLVAVNLADNGAPNGKIDLLMLDAKALEAGTAKVLKKNTISGTPGKTLSFRQDFTPDGKYILQSGADRFILIDADSLKAVDEEMMTMSENHDAVSTADGKYAILTLRVSVGEEKDGQILLYDIENKKTVGKAASVCFGCHSGMGIHGSAVLCGADAKWN